MVGLPALGANTIYLPGFQVTKEHPHFYFQASDSQLLDVLCNRPDFQISVTNTATLSMATNFNIHSHTYINIVVDLITQQICL